MFERTAVRRPTDITGLAGFDTGALAESLLFYGTTSLVLDPGSLKEILRNVGVDSVVRLARDDAVRVLYAPNMTTIPNAGSLPAAGWGLSTVSTPAWQPDRFIPDAFYEVMGRRGAARRASSRFLDRLELVSPDAFRPDSDEAVIAETVSEQAVREVLRYVAPGYALPADVRFEVSYDNAAGYAVQTNLDFSAITAEHQRFYNTTNDVTVSHVLLTLAGVAEDVGMAAYFGSDLTLTPMRAALIKLRAAGNAGVSGTHEASAQGRLQELVFGESRAIAEAVNAGRVPFSDILDLAEHAGQFRHWLAGQEPDADLVRAYFQEATRESWVERLPAVVARWLAVTAAGTAAGMAVAGPIGIAAGPVVSGADLITARLQGRWSPGQFLQRRVRSTLFNE